MFLQVEQTFQDKLEEVKRMRLQGETRLAAAPVPEGKQVLFFLSVAKSEVFEIAR